MTNRKSLTYIFGTTSNENTGRHSIGVNKLLYNDFNNTLISGGRDGQVSIWNLAEPFCNTTNRKEHIKEFVETKWQDESAILKLENRITNKGLVGEYTEQHNEPQLANTNNVHLDWINDMAQLDSYTIATCSNDMSIRLWNYNTNQLTTIGYHSDYIKKISYNKDYATQMVSGGLDRCLNIWDLNRGTVVSSSNSQNEKGSIYSLHSSNNLIITGGPTNVINLFDRRFALKTPVKTFLGHTENIRSLVIKNNMVLSGSSDTTVKLWDMRTTRVLKNFNIHDSPVWSLEVPTECDDLSVFYSADKRGLLFKTDTRASSNNIPTDDYISYKLNEAIGLSVLVGDYNSGCAHSTGITSITLSPKTNQVWTSTSSSSKNVNTNFISGWVDPSLSDFVKYQGIKVNLKANTLNPQTSSQSVHSGNDEDLVSILSNEDLDQIDRALSFHHLDNIESSIKEDLALDSVPNYSCFVDLNGEINEEFLIDLLSQESVHDDHDSLNPFSEQGFDRVEKLARRQRINLDVLDEAPRLVPYCEKPLINIEGTSSLVKCKLLNNRRHVAAMDDTGFLYIYDILSCQLIKRIDQNLSVESVENSDRDSSQEMELKSIAAANSNINMSEKFESVCNTLQTEETLPMWCSVQVKAGKLFITLKKDRFSSCELYSDDLDSLYPQLNFSEITEATRINVGQMLMNSFFQKWVEQIEKEYTGSIPHLDKSHQRNSSDCSIVLEKEHTGEHLSRFASTVSPMMTPPASSSSVNRKDKGSKMGMFGKFMGNKNERKTSSSSLTTAENETNKLETIDSTPALLKYVRQYPNKLSLSKNGLLFNYESSDVKIVINEDSGSDAKPLLITSINTLMSLKPQLRSELERCMPLWLSSALLLNKLPALPDSCWVAFVLKPVSIGPNTNKDVNNRLTATGALRVGRMVDFIRTRFEKRNVNVELICRNQILDKKMTLAAMKNRVWKKGGDVEVYYKIV